MIAMVFGTAVDTNYKKSELLWKAKFSRVLGPMMDRIDKAKDLADKFRIAGKMATEVKARKKALSSFGKDAVPAAFTLVSERFYATDFKTPSKNQKENFKAADYFFSNFKREFLDYAFSRGKMPKFDEKITYNHLLALESFSRNDGSFRSHLIGRMRGVLGEQKNGLDGAAVMSLRLAPLVGARGLMFELKTLGKMKLKPAELGLVNGCISDLQKQAKVPLK